jgi:acylphosphatase
MSHKTPSSPPAQARLHAHVYGVVQGVNFRYHTRRQARALLLSGWVRNRSDGSVEVLAEGPRPQLEALLRYLHRGPPAAQVMRVDVAWDPAQGDLSGFDVKY